VKVYDTHSKQLVDLRPVNPDWVTMYVCGPTVYDRAHLGNARSAIVFDLLFRVLRDQYPTVTYARNFTDIDDKIITRSDELGISFQDLTEQTIAWYHDDMDSLGVLRPTHEPRATKYIQKMIDAIQTIIDNGDAYETQDGHVYFSTSTDNNQKYARVISSSIKTNSADFVLWKPALENQPGWQAGFGGSIRSGRPGWHIECSVMATELLGDTFDIHGGGCDLQFPHHHNETCQAKSINPEADYARHWMHNGMLTIDGKKMSKSLGNFTTVHDLLVMKIPPPAIRMMLLSTRYGDSLDLTDRLLGQYITIWRSWSLAVQNVDSIQVPLASTGLLNDLNTPETFALMHEFTNTDKLGELKYLMEIMGIDWTYCEFDDETVTAIQLIMKSRQQARDNKDFRISDGIRADVAEFGIHIMDVAGAQEWTAVGIVNHSALMNYSVDTPVFQC